MSMLARKIGLASAVIFFGLAFSVCLPVTARAGYQAPMIFSAATSVDASVTGTASLALVIDDTGSMVDEINGVKTSLKNAITEIKSKDLLFPKTLVYTFKDDVTFRTETNSPDVIIAVIDTFTATGGGDTPEASNEALITAGKNLSDSASLGSGRKSKVFFATDAISRPEGPSSSDVAAVFNSKGIQFHCVWTGEYEDFSKTSAGLSGTASVNRATAAAADSETGAKIFKSLADAVPGSSFTQITADEMSKETGQRKFEKILTDMVVTAAEEETAASDDAKETSGDTPVTPAKHSSGGGCNAGFASLLLLVSGGFLFALRKSR